MQRHCNHGFSISSSLWLLRIGMRGLWSVIPLKYCRPVRNTLHFHMAHATANSSSSITAYPHSASVRQQDPACTRFHCRFVTSCCITNPKPCLLVSVHNHVLLVTSKNNNSGALVRCFFSFATAWSRSSVHVNLFFVLSRGRSGASSSAILFMLELNWFTNLTNDRSSDRLVGVGNCDIAAVIDESNWYPSDVNRNPANVTCFWPYLHLSLLIIASHVLRVAGDLCCISQCHLLSYGIQSVLPELRPSCGYNVRQWMKDHMEHAGI